MLFCAIHIITPIERLKDYETNKTLDHIHTYNLQFLLYDSTPS